MKQAVLALARVFVSVVASPRVMAGMTKASRCRLVTAAVPNAVVQ